VRQTLNAGVEATPADAGRRYRPPMTPDDTPDDLLDRLSNASGCFELAREYTYVGYREHPTAGPREVRITVRDSGRADHQVRWSVSAVDEDGRAAAGNAGPTLDVVIATVHWSDLDKAPVA
jgi:hypothetical protein